MATSYSRWSTHQKCGLKYKFAYQDKIQVDRGPPAPAMLRGTRLHDSAEAYVLGATDLDPELEYFAKWLHGLRENYVCHPERKWAFDVEGNICDFDAEEGFLRGVWDLLVEPESWEQPLDVMEYKSGKIYDGHKHQRHLYGLAGLLHFPEAESVRVRTVYFDKQTFHEETWTRKQVSEMLEKWENWVNLMYMENTWIPNPSWSCKYCEFSRNSGGPCRF